MAVLLLTSALARSADTAWEQAQSKQLWLRPEWLKLVHYEAGLWPDSWHSQTLDQHFFLSDSGATDPRAELQATLEAFSAPAEQGDRHAQCRFVARLTWLKNELDLGELPQPDCAEYRNFRKGVHATRAVLVFPSYYLNSPSSMFGHTLLRLDSGDADGGSEYLSFAANFGALVKPDDNGLFYAFKGLTGGYPGQFEVDQYYKKIHEYNRSENRDIWEYPLDLTPDETERLIQHLWELRGINFAYYFFDKNCSYRIVELLDVARPGIDLARAFPLTAIPIDTVREVQRAGLVRGKYFRPAQGTSLKERLAVIPSRFDEFVADVSQSPERLDDPDLQALDPATRASVIDAAYKYLRYTQTNMARDPAVAQRSFRLLQALQQHAADLPPPALPPDPASSPDLSHDSRRVMVGLLHEDRRDFAVAGLRLSLHSLEENRTGFPAGAQINLGNLELRVDDKGKVGLNRFDVIDIISLSPRDRFFKPLSWSVLTGIDRQWTDGRDRAVAHIDGGVGVTRTLWGDNRAYGLATARLEYNDGFAEPLQPAIGARAGMLLGAGRLTSKWEAGVDQFANGVVRTRVGLSSNLRVSRDQAVVLDVLWRRQPADEKLAIGLRYQYYY